MNGKSTNGSPGGMACIEGLPPLPKSLSGLLNSSGGSWREMERMYVKKTMIQDDLSRGRNNADSLLAHKPANLDAALALLRKEMVKIPKLFTLVGHKGCFSSPGAVSCPVLANVLMQSNKVMLYFARLCWRFCFPVRRGRIAPARLQDGSVCYCSSSSEVQQSHKFPPCSDWKPPSDWEGRACPGSWVGCSDGEQVLPRLNSVPPLHRPTSAGGGGGL
uniref:Protein FAM89A n=1 Tax=Takifugu rubripes TaxID=31033 RepID=A0A674MPA5_TAKRU